MDNGHKLTYRNLQEKFADYIRGEINSSELKHHAAPLGVYQQRNGLFMARIRIPGGHLTLKQWRDAFAIAARHGAGFVHLTTRQNIQVHDLKPEQVYPLVSDCYDTGLYFIGGGGDTFRNIIASPDSGFNPAEAFDVIPHTRELTRLIFDWPKAFCLPRKFKIGVFSSVRDEEPAAIQDLGFVAVESGGKPGFRVYGGGGMGGSSAFGILLLDWVPANAIPRCAWAMTELFSEHGNRENRAQARIRFILKRLGGERFRELFMDAFRRAPLDFDDFPGIDIKPDPPTVHPEEPEPGGDYKSWLRMATTPTSFGNDVVSVRLRVPGGNLSPEEMDKLGTLAEICGDSFLRLTPDQDLILPLVHRSALPRVYRYLLEELGGIDLTLKSFAGHLTSCVGAAVCKIGILESPLIANAIAVRLDEYFNAHPERKGELAGTIIDAIRISGCHNACSCHPTARIGLQGMKRKLDGEPEAAYRFFLRDSESRFQLSIPEEEPIPFNDVPEKLLSLLL